MSKVFIQEKMIRLEEDQLKSYKEQLNKKTEKEMELIKQIEVLKTQNESLKDEISKIDKNVHNSRNAGRKPIITEKQIAEIQMMRAQGMTLQVIQKEIGFSYGIVQKHCKKLKEIK